MPHLTLAPRPRTEAEPTAPTVAYSGVYRPELDALRFLAFCMVFFTHVTHFTAPTWEQKLGFPAWLAEAAVTLSMAGAFGVYLFFTLSAYLITTLLLVEKERTGRVSVKRFYTRRALRIWPLYFFVLLCGMIAFPADLAVLPYFLLFAGNWIEVAGANPSFFIMALWSISVEEQFYLLWAPLAAKLTRKGMRNAAICMLLAPAVFLPIGFAMGMHGWRFAFLNSFSCVSAMGVGVLLAIYPLPKVSRLVLFTVGTVALYAGSALDLGRAPVTSVVAIALVNVFSACFLIGFVGLRARPAFVGLGRVSYGLYVYHPIALGLVAAVLGARLMSVPWHIVMVSTGFAVAVVLAAASYRLIESPFLRLKDRFAFVHSKPV